ncbi:kinesin-like nuclear fusion protein [Nowakowskiella sp. JEL0407]|nr:kinesin-like nuclear fusion protein [Nowakowskiella sp. JEL0407]
MPQTPTRLKPPSKTHVDIKLPQHFAHAKPSSEASDPVAPPAASNSAPKEIFEVHTTNLKRKADDSESSIPAPSQSSKSKIASLARPADSEAPTNKRQKIAPSAKPAQSVTAKPTTRATTRTTTATSRVGTKVATKEPPRTTATRSTRSVTAKTTTTKANAEDPPKKTKRSGRLEDLDHEVENLKSQKEMAEQQMEEVRLQKELTEKQIEQSQRQNEELEKIRLALQNTVQTKEIEKSSINKEYEALKMELKNTIQKNEDEQRELEKKKNSQINDLKDELHSAQRQNERFKSEIDMLTKENTSLKGVISTQSTTTIALESENKALKLQKDDLDKLSKDQARKIEEMTEMIATLEAKERESETIRRRLHNTIQELKGNIRVFCRVRPTLPGEPLDTPKYIQYPENEENSIELVQSVETSSGTKTAKVYPFTFDKVFQPNTSQAVVFDEISQLVQSALDGFNVCIFAYGQTGSGKTHTMEGPTQPDPEQMGMIPRAVEQIFVTSESLKEKGWVYTMEAQFLEIYNETLRDLLDNDDNPGKKREIKHLGTGKTIVTDCVNVVVNNPREVHNLLKKASHNRAVAATQCNERSSRSHSVFTLRLSGRNDLTDETIEGNLNLIDLAGSERLSSSGSTGERLKETQAINKSLSCLGDVIYALANRDGHVPYRNSKLTYLLQNSLGGNSKTLMFVNVSPLNLNETLNSLRFATKVNSCQIGTAKKSTRG